MVNRNLLEIQEALLGGMLKVEDLISEYVDRIVKTEHLNIYVEVFRDEAMERAKVLDEKVRLNPNSLGKLFGAIISIKDVLCYKNHKVTAASKILDGFTSTFSATAVQAALAEDAIIIGRTNCDEFAMGSTNENSIYGPTINGLDPERVPGGSSGAAAVSVQQHTCLMALGTDTGGSVRQPAAYCGVIGFKPTYGRVSRYGLIAYASSFDQIGIIGHHVDDIQMLLNVIEGPDELDGTSAHRPATPSLLSQPEFSYSLAYLPEVLDHPELSLDMKNAFLGVLNNFTSMGHTIKEVHFELLDYLVPAYYVLTTAEASSNLSRYDGLRYGYRDEKANSLDEVIIGTRSKGFGTEVKRRVMMGTFVLSVGYYDAYFLKAQKVRRMIKEQIDALFEHDDFLILPTTTDVAPRLGDALKNPVDMYLSDIFTVLANLCGYPAISIPLNHPQNHLPASLQIVAKPFDEARLLHLASSFVNMA